MNRHPPWEGCYRRHSADFLIANLPRRDIVTIIQGERQGAAIKFHVRELNEKRLRFLRRFFHFFSPLSNNLSAKIQEDIPRRESLIRYTLPAHFFFCFPERRPPLSKTRRKVAKKLKSFHLFPFSFYFPRLHAPTNKRGRNRPDQLLYKIPSLPRGACKSKDAINRRLIAILRGLSISNFELAKDRDGGRPMRASAHSYSFVASRRGYLLAGHRIKSVLPLCGSFLGSINFPSSQFPQGESKNCFRFASDSFEDLLNALSLEFCCYGKLQAFRRLGAFDVLVYDGEEIEFVVGIEFYNREMET